MVLLYSEASQSSREGYLYPPKRKSLTPSPIFFFFINWIRKSKYLWLFLLVPLRDCSSRLSIFILKFDFIQICESQAEEKRLLDSVKQMPQALHASKQQQVWCIRIWQFSFECRASKDNSPDHLVGGRDLCICILH